MPGPLTLTRKPLSAGDGATPPFGVYLHVPFCAARCDYCAFATWTDRHDLQDAYLDACRRDVERHVAAGMPPVTSVFVGGGTPSLVPPRALAAVLDALPRAPGCELTVECNPDTVTAELVEVYAAAGVNRISLGVQSMVEHVLVALGRTHDPASVARAVGLIRAAGIPTFNVDVIYGAAGETLDDWRRTLDGILALEPPHVSAYALTVEPGTPLADDPARHPDDDDQAAKYELATERLAAAGLGWYEISNWARPGHECRHNQLYWSMGEYQAFGCAGHSHRDGRRFWNVRTPERYIDAIDAGRSPVAAGERLDEPARRVEALSLALRTSAGVPVDALSADDRAELEGLVEERDERLVLTVRGRLLANEVAVRLRWRG
ncbi:MAG TPA: radical SAM family heme chaperone HemW [Acidimicrobiales bacterium]